jgi:hypothetical protein
VARQGLPPAQCARAAQGLLGTREERGQREEATLAEAEDEPRIYRDIGRGGVIGRQLRMFSASHKSASRVVFTKKGNLARGQIPFEWRWPGSSFVYSIAFKLLTKYSVSPKQLVGTPTCCS